MGVGDDAGLAAPETVSGTSGRPGFAQEPAPRADFLRTRRFCTKSVEIVSRPILADRACNLLP